MTPAVGAPAGAQTDYYNTDTGRPLTIEDASAIERYAFDLQLAPLRLERTRDGVYEWTVEPEVAYGILPRTQVEVGAPVSYRDANTGSDHAGLGGISLSLLHNLNIETSIPALAFSGEVLFPVGRFAPNDPVYAAKAIATKTFQWARFHLNGEYTFGPDHADGGEISRWLAGVAADRTFPLRSMLVGAELFARQAMLSNSDPQWNAAVGVRRQLSPSLSIDVGAGKQLTGDDQRWFATFGVARAFAIRALLPGQK